MSGCHISPEGIESRLLFDEIKRSRHKVFISLSLRCCIKEARHAYDTQPAAPLLRKHSAALGTEFFHQRRC